MTQPSLFGVGLSRSGDPALAVREACAPVRAALDGAEPTLAVVFASPALCEDAEALLAAIHTEIAPGHLIGAMGEAIVGQGREIEDGPALAVWAAVLPGTEVVPFRLVARPVGEGMGVLGWPDAIADAPAGNIGPVIMLADPFTFPADGLLAELNEEPGAPVIVGGLASGGLKPGEHRLFAGEDVLLEGAVAVALRGARMSTVVSQGCMPIGRRW
jgi:small ligand-binding sensory domain FIST